VCKEALPAKVDFHSLLATSLSKNGQHDKYDKHPKYDKYYNSYDKYYNMNNKNDKDDKKDKNYKYPKNAIFPFGRAASWGGRM